MGSIFGGGGGGKSKTEAKSEYPEEFKPLASSSVKQIQAAQDALPLANFASPQPRQIAGLSPYTVAGMELVPFVSNTTVPEQSLMAMQPYWNDLANRAVGMMQPSTALQSSTDFLLGTLGRQGSLPQGNTSPVAWAPYTPLPMSAFGVGAPIPSPEIQNVGSTIPIAPLMPTSPIPPPQVASAAPPSAPAPGAPLVGLENNLTYGRSTFDDLIAKGYSPQQAYFMAQQYEGGITSNSSSG